MKGWIAARQARWLAVLVLGSLWLLAAAQAVPPPPGFTPDPATVQRWQTGAYSGWRYPQAGWTVLHIEGPPRDRGLQHGHLMATEIAAHIRALSEFWGPQAPAAAWAQNRRVAQRLFGQGFPPEQMQEMRGIVDGANAAGARAHGRLLDVLDIIVLNTSNEIDTLHDALLVTPNAPQLRIATQQPLDPILSGTHKQRRRPQRCNAFIANGAATADGQIVFGHITMYDLYPANFYNVWMEVKPTQGYRFVMQSTPGGMHSGMDYSINEAGILLAETTLDQGPLINGGTPLAARIRQAQQYAGSIDEAAALLTKNDNGLCSTEWVMGDLKRNEIALLTLAGGQSRLHRSSQNQWFQGAEGFYWSDNNIKEPGARLAATARRDGRPSASAAYIPSKRDEVWLREYRAHKGKIDLDFARKLLSTPEIVSAFGVDAKYTDANLAAQLHSWGSFGPPTGALWAPTPKEARDHAEIRPLIQNPWTLLTVQPPPAGPVTAAADQPHPRQAWPSPKPAVYVSPPPYWRGTLLPASDADIWLSTGFARYERLLAEMNAPSRSTRTPADARDDIGVEVAYYRSWFGRAARAGHDRPLAATRADMGDPLGYQGVAGKGVLFLHTLRGVMGAQAFDAAARALGRERDGQPVSTQQFQAFLQRHTARPLGPLFDWWTQQPGLPLLGVAGAESRAVGSGWQTEVTLDVSRVGPALAVPVTVETADGDVTQTQVFDRDHPRIRITTRAKPVRVVVDKHGTTARGNGSPFTILTMDDELENALIVYGTRDDEVGNHEAARLLQTALRRREHNVQPPIQSDREVSEEDLRGHHLLLVGRPSTNAVSQRVAAQWPVDFGAQSFAVRGQRYTHPESAVLAAGDNPLNPRYSAVLIAGLGNLGTYQIVGKFSDELLGYAPVVVVPFGRTPRELSPPLAELTLQPVFR
ncbi:C45 family autoproteolytic acyltransferase/hydolase [Ottowia sp.]|uniref:C45 family autoproteolytic acyltransferase/hydolase n=1 Tax=Ottowia sp. TaxID=1898956 RepID=UPI002C40C989|nr:C45 family autoproteolytic acyltransferase/hydolase [Ottowia sp.]HOB65878.1 C45 family autoproteolytic acyltransferase/hydrolase [Ottowia sp.]HPZ56862.1 C45 family autoproteolytic acyltransferase/hydrolase [Ottowia sp.]HQD47286.1 C45 family autoproteolytic acyltransferase/hydrolase [Ottowia sp.]